LRDALPEKLERLVEDADLERIRVRLAAASTLPPRANFVSGDFVGALGIFLLVVLGTFPVALPFLFVKDVTTALIASRVLTLVMLFIAGFALGRYTGAGAMKAGVAMIALGTSCFRSLCITPAARSTREAEHLPRLGKPSTTAR
jgi:VIT1/CCC1 family predicted Fe2+/Mn2+ transporter